MEDGLNYIRSILNRISESNENFLLVFDSKKPVNMEIGILTSKFVYQDRKFDIFSELNEEQVSKIRKNLRCVMINSEIKKFPSSYNLYHQNIILSVELDAEKFDKDKASEILKIQNWEKNQTALNFLSKLHESYKSKDITFAYASCKTFNSLFEKSKKYPLALTIDFCLIFINKD